MRKLFAGYFKPTQAEFEALWNDCVFAFDANTLLNVYRYTPVTSEVLLDLIKRFSERVWLPYQAAHEYHNNRLTVIAAQKALYDLIEKKLKDSLQAIEEVLNQYSQHPVINKEELIKRLRDHNAKSISFLQELRSKHPDLTTEDPLRDRIADIFDSKVGPPYSQEESDKMNKEADARYKQEIPPGYKDSKKDTPREYGDFIIWCQLIDYAKQSKRPLLFITDDGKEDWWLVHKGKTIGPRPELIQEMRQKADIPFYMYQTDQFMTYAQRHLKLAEQKAAIEEVKEVQRMTREGLSAALGAVNAAKLYAHTFPPASSFLLEQSQIGNAIAAISSASGVIDAVLKELPKYDLSPAFHTLALSAAVNDQLKLIMAQDANRLDMLRRLYNPIPTSAALTELAKNRISDNMVAAAIPEDSGANSENEQSDEAKVQVSEKAQGAKEPKE